MGSRLNSTMRFLSSIKIVRVMLALVVALWMAGAGCMLGCENMVAGDVSNAVASPASSPGIVVNGEACASMHSHDCCAKRETHSAARATKSRFIVGTPSSPVAALTGTMPTMIDCPLAVNAAAALSKAGTDEAKVVLPSSTARELLVSLPEHPKGFARPLRLPNRGHTYLRCCVFLI